jgi:cytochrome c-type biogenesis protein CcmE
MKFKYIVILIAIISLFALYAVSLLSRPAFISLSELQTYNGQKVIVQGTVIDYRTTTFGSQLITIRDNENFTHSVTLYIEGQALVDYGDLIQATGEVQHYKEQWEVIVDNPRFITLLEKWDNQSIPLWQLAENPGNYLGTNVNVTGTVTKKHASSFLLTDRNKDYSIEVYYDTIHPHDFSNDDVVAVAGRVLYEPTTLRYILKIIEHTHGVWKTDG